MLFSSQVFILLFLPIVIVAFHFGANSRTARLGLLLVASFLFYAWWDLRFLPLLASLILFNWGVVTMARRTERTGLLVVGVGINLLTLGGFKYANFFAESVYGLIGIDFEPWGIILPLGISFFTFQQISYLLDVRRGRAGQYPLLDYATYVSFFPQLIAGPIVRHNELIPQFERLQRKVDGEIFARGLILFTLGVAKKVFLADELAPIADIGFNEAATGAGPDFWVAWQSAIGYSLQLYFDFSSYSDMAMGLGGMFGLDLPINFNRPYHATTIRDFWRRWHITLSSFFRDYVYVPLGGSRQALTLTCLTAFGTMLLCGLWHGAGWTFIAWGALHGLAIVINRLWAAGGKPLPFVFSWAVTLLFVVIGWVLFRAENFTIAWRMLCSMFAGGLAGFEFDLWWIVVAASIFALGGPTNIEISRRASLPGKAMTALLAILLVAVCLRVGQGRGLEFIYFQF